MKEIIPLAKDTINNNDIDNLIGWLKTYPQLTKGPLTVEFEAKWAEFVGTKYAVFVNSGSSANLLMLYVLIFLNKIKTHKIVVPTLSWATDLSPVMQLCTVQEPLEPILVDCNLENLSVDIEHLEEIFKNEHPDALMLVSVLGLPPNMTEICHLCQQYNVILLEDVCEGLGSKFENKMLGNFGLMSSFSLFFAHHLSTIEGGVICTNDFKVYEALKMIRSHGWDRDLSHESQKELRDSHGVSKFNALYSFFAPGFNVRSTDLQAFLGIDQLKKAKSVIDNRNKNYKTYNNLIKNDFWTQKIPDYNFVSNFCYPIIHPNKNKIIEKLIENGVGVRPLICGSMGTQPFYYKKYGKKIFKNASIVDDYGLYVPNHHLMTYEEITTICSIINKFTT